MVSPDKYRTINLYRRKDFMIMENKKINDIKKKIEGILAKQDAKRKEYEDKISAAEKMISSGNDDMNAAYGRNDASAYHIAQDKIREAKDSIQMYEDSIKKLDAEHLISQEEFFMMRDAIIEELKKATDASRIQCLRLIDQMKVSTDDLAELINFGNDILFDLQVNVYRDGAYHNAQNEVVKRHTLCRYNDFGLSDVVGMITGYAFYQKWITERDALNTGND